MIRLFRVFIPKSIVALLILDFLLIITCFAVGMTVSFGIPLFEFIDIPVLFDSDDAFLSLIVATISVMLALYLQDMYTNLRSRSVTEIMTATLTAIGAMLIIQSVLAYGIKGLVLPRMATLYGSLILFAILTLWRFVFVIVIYRGFGSDRVLFLGADSVGVEIAGKMAGSPELGFMPIGFLDDHQPVGTIIQTCPVLGTISDLKEIAKSTRPDIVVVNLSERRASTPVETLLDMRFAGTRILEAFVAYERAFGRITIRLLRPSHLIFSTELGPRRWSLRLQTLYSFLISLIGLILAAPVMLLVALAVRLTSRGPVLFRQNRVGLNGEVFTLYKFRSMVVDAEATTGAVWATKNDPRVTSIGGFLRKTRLDELPQLFNVLMGQMAIVGPRPERPEFVQTLSEAIPFYRQRHCVKPGATGWAQINYKYGDTMEDTMVKLEYDLYYIKNLSPSLDLYIIFHTVKVMLFSSHGQ